MNKLLFLLITLLSFSATSSYAKDIDKLIGVWRYVGSVSNDGTKDSAFSKNSLDYIIYTSEGIVSVEIIPPDKNSKDFFAYSGHFIIDEKKHIVTHQVEIAVLPDMINQDYARYYRFENNRLYLTVVGSQTGMTLIWERIK